MCSEILSRKHNPTDKELVDRLVNLGDDCHDLIVVSPEESGFPVWGLQTVNKAGEKKWLIGCGYEKKSAEDLRLKLMAMTVNDGKYVARVVNSIEASTKGYKSAAMIASFNDNRFGVKLVPMSTIVNRRNDATKNAIKDIIDGDDLYNLSRYRPALVLNKNDSPLFPLKGFAQRLHDKHLVDWIRERREGNERARRLLALVKSYQ